MKTEVLPYYSMVVCVCSNHAWKCSYIKYSAMMPIPLPLYISWVQDEQTELGRYHVA